MRSILIAFTLIIGYTSGLLGQKTALDSIFNLALTQSSAGDVPGTTSLLLAAQKIAEAENNQQMLCKIQIAMGKVAIIAENDAGVEEATQKALALCSACKDTQSLARAYLQIGVLNLKHQQYDSAIINFKLSSDYYLLKKDTMGAANASAKIGNALEVQGFNKEAQTYYLRFYEATKNAPNSRQFLTANIYLTANCLNLDQFDKAFEHNQQVKRLAQQLSANFE